MTSFCLMTLTEVMLSRCVNTHILLLVQVLESFLLSSFSLVLPEDLPYIAALLYEVHSS